MTDNDAYQEMPNGWKVEEPPISQRFGRSGTDWSPVMAVSPLWVLIDARASSSSKGAQARASAIKRHGGKWEGRTVRNKTQTNGKKTYRAYLRYVGVE